MENNHEGHFYKGLFFGLLLGVGVALFGQTEKGKKVLKQAKNKLDKAISQPLMESFDDEEEIGIVQEPIKSKAKPRKKFFKKK